MFIYNVTIKIDNSIHQDWVKWMNEEHIADIMSCGCFEKYQFVKLLDIDDVEGSTYAVQYYAASKAQYEQYIDMYASNMRKASTDKWGDKFIAFRTLMEVVS